MSRVNLEITLGIAFVLIASFVLVFYGLGEEDRMANYALREQGRAIEEGSALFATNCSGCHGIQGEGISGLCPPLNDRYFFDDRLADVGWSGTLEDYIVSTVAGGRLVSTRPEQYAGQGSPAMPAWSQDFGGPLTQNQIRNIASFIMNWESTAPLREAAGPVEGSVGTDIIQQLPTGDPVNGEALANSQGCVGCHVSTATGPAWPPSEGQAGIGDRAASRIEQADYTGNASTGEQYLLESIVQPNVFVVEGYPANIMLGNYGETLTPQEAADLIAYMLTIK